MDANATVPGGKSEPSYMLALWNLVIRPPRARYNVQALGPKVVEVSGGLKAVREDMRLRTPRGVHLECSYFQLQTAKSEKVPVVIYLHGNASCRLEAFDVLHSLLYRRFSVFCYDAAGCGHSEGDYVSLGWHERDDLAFVIDYLRNSSGNNSPRVGPIGIWGRSMGAVTALMHAARDPTVGAICVDSPFASLTQLMWELGNSEHSLVRAPNWLFAAAVALVRMRVKTLAGFDVDDVVPVQHVSKCHVPALFIHAQKDDFVVVGHSQQLFDAYAGDKEFIQVGGDHNTMRGATVVGRALDFFCRALRHGPYRRPPPAHRRGDEAMAAPFVANTRDDPAPMLVPRTVPAASSAEALHPRPSRSTSGQVEVNATGGDRVDVDTSQASRPRRTNSVGATPGPRATAMASAAAHEEIGSAVSGCCCCGEDASRHSRLFDAVVPRLDLSNARQAPTANLRPNKGPTDTLRAHQVWGDMPAPRSLGPWPAAPVPPCPEASTTSTAAAVNSAVCATVAVAVANLASKTERAGPPADALKRRTPPTMSPPIEEARSKSPRLTANDTGAATSTQGRRPAPTPLRNLSRAAVRAAAVVSASSCLGRAAATAAAGGAALVTPSGAAVDVRFNATLSEEAEQAEALERAVRVAGLEEALELLRGFEEAESSMKNEVDRMQPSSRPMLMSAYRSWSNDSSSSESTTLSDRESLSPSDRRPQSMAYPTALLV